MGERETSQVTESLLNRIAANDRYGTANLTDWLVSQLRLGHGETVLDVGCGTGKHLLRFAREIGVPGAATGIDISATSLETARQRSEEEGLTVGLHALSMDDLQAFATSHTFTTITSIYALYYARDAGAVLANLHRMLPSDGAGRIAVMGPYSDNNSEWFRFIGQFMTLPDAVRESTTTFMYDHVLSYAEEHFGSIRCERFENAITIPTLSDLRRYWQSNIYYKPEFDPAFETFAARHFAEHDSFRYRKVGQLIVMSSAIQR